MRHIFRWLLRIAVLVLVLLGASLLWGRFLPFPSTLMLARWAIFQPTERDWQPLTAMSRAVVEAAIASEDQRYCSHNGVDFIALQEVLSDDDGPSRGASTITMQVAKNVYLWPGRSYIRKGLEIPLALVLDAVWGKTRVLEVYLNIAEWGEGIFGAEAAARHYYGKRAAELTSQEAARLIAALPNPITRHADRASSASRRVLSRMGEIKPLTECVRP